MKNLCLHLVAPPQPAVTLEKAQVGETTGEVHKMMAFSFVNEWYVVSYFRYAVTTSTAVSHRRVCVSVGPQSRSLTGNKFWLF